MWLQGLGHFTDDVLFGEVWLRKELAPRDRSIVTISALISTGKAAQVAGHTRRALNNGVTPAEIGEVITHLALYSGWPNAISAVLKLRRFLKNAEFRQWPTARPRGSISGRRLKLRVNLPSIAASHQPLPRWRN